MTPSPAKATSSTSIEMPGSKRTLVPAGTASRRAHRGLPIELQCLVGLREVEVRTDLHRAVAGVEHASATPDPGPRAARRRPRRGGPRRGRAGRRRRRRSPGASGAGWIGPCRVTSLVPSGKVASAWSSSISVSTPSITSEVSSTSRPADMISATDMPSRAASSTQAVSTATASGWLSSSPRSRRRRATSAAPATISRSCSWGVSSIRPPTRAQWLVWCSVVVD